VCMDEGASRVSSEVNTDDFRGSIKLLALLTEPGDANGGYAQRHARWVGGWACYGVLRNAML